MVTQGVAELVVRRQKGKRIEGVGKRMLACGLSPVWGEREVGYYL